MEELFALSNRLISRTKNKFIRYLYSDINWEARLIEIKGARGTGKTTLMLQKAKELYKKSAQSVMYVTLDDAYFFNHTIKETAEQFYNYGGKYLFLDEVHKYPPKYKNFDWSSELKNIYDFFPDLNIIYSGSSIIELHKGNGDLSRRKTSYTLNGLSFREYIQLNEILNYPVISLKDILKNHLQISTDITSRIKILPHFKNYLKYGYYPFYKESPEQYYQKIKNIVNVVLETDIPAITDINFDIIAKIKKLLAVLSTTVPYTPNLTKLSNELNVADLRTLYKYLNLLESAELISLLRTDKKGNKILHKPEKVLLNNTNLLYALFDNNIEQGTIREIFFYNQTNVKHKLNYPKYGDFLVDDKYTFEIGGKSKTLKQIQNINNSFIVKDDIETGVMNVIPLWMLGLLY